MGYAEGQNVQVECHWLEGIYEQLNSAPNNVIRRHVWQVIAIPGSTPVSLAAKAATTSIPIVFGVTENPVALGLVRSLAQPGATATGTNFFAIEIEAKRLDLMHNSP